MRRHRSLSLICLSALVLSGLAVGGPASAAPAAQASPTAAAVPDELVVGYVAGATAEQRERARGRASAQRAERVVTARADRTEVELVRLPQGKNRYQAIAELQSDPAVAYAEPNWVYSIQGKPVTQGKPGSGTPAVTPDYFSNGSLWGMYGDGMYGDNSSPKNAFGSQAAEAWAANHTGSKEVYVGVIDEGIQFSHPDLEANVWTNPVDSTFDGVRQRRQRLCRRRPRLGLRRQRQQYLRRRYPR